MMPRVLIADDHQVVVDGLIRLLDGHCVIAGTVADGALVVDAVERLRPDLLLLDISMPHISGLEVLRQLRARGIEQRSVVLTMHGDAGLAAEALRNGAGGFVLKESNGQELLAALDVVLAGRTYLPPSLTQDILASMLGGVPETPLAQLTSLQREVLRQLVQGKQAKEIAAALQVSARTVEGLKRRTMRTLGAQSTADVIRIAVERRLVPF
jgi:DNA-binding NarL/FixJ family response regulator